MCDGRSRCRSDGPEVSRKISRSATAGLIALGLSVETCTKVLSRWPDRPADIRASSISVRPRAVGVAEMLVDILDQHLSPIKANLWASLARSDCHLWYFARPPHRLALGTHQHHPYDAADQHDDPTDHEAGVEIVKW